MSGVCSWVSFQTQLWIENLFLAFSPFPLKPPQIQLRTSRASPAADEGGGGGCGEEVKPSLKGIEGGEGGGRKKQEVGKWQRGKHGFAFFTSSIVYFAHNFVLQTTLVHCSGRHNPTL